MLKNLENIRIIDSNDKQLLNSHYCLVIVLKKNITHFRKNIINKLNSLGVGTSIYYPQPVPRMTYYKNKYGYIKNKFTNAEMFSDSSISLPVGPHLNLKHMKFIAKSVKTIIKSLKND